MLAIMPKMQNYSQNSLISNSKNQTSFKASSLSPEAWRNIHSQLAKYKAKLMEFGYPEAQKTRLIHTYRAELVSKAQKDAGIKGLNHYIN